MVVMVMKMIMMIMMIMKMMMMMMVNDHRDDSVENYGDDNALIKNN